MGVYEEIFFPFQNANVLEMVIPNAKIGWI